MSNPFSGAGGEPEPVEEADLPASPPTGTGGVFSLAGPTMATYGLHALVGVVDFAFVSSLGSESIAAVGVAAQIHFLVFGLLTAVTTGTVAVVAREWGAGNRAEAARAARAALLLSGALAAAVMAVMPFSTEAVSLLGVEAGVAELGGECLWLLLAFNVPFAVGIAGHMALRGVGDVRTPLAVGIVTNAVNALLDYALIFGELGAPELGAPGSALASGLTFSVGALLLLALWTRGMLRIATGPWLATLTRERAWRQLCVGLPTMVEHAAWQVGLLLFLGIVARYGTEPVSAYLIGVRILSLCFVPGLGFSTAASTLVGQYLGAENASQAARAGWRANAGALAVMASIGLVIVLAARPLAGIFGAAGDRTIELTVTFIYILGAAQPLMAVEFALSGALRGAGDTRFPLFAILTGLFGFRLAAAELIAGPLFDRVEAVWMCLLADYIVKAAMLTYRFAGGRWKRVRV